MAVETHEAYLERRIAGGKLAALTDFPRYFEVETINACQAKCPMCTIADWQRTPQVMKDDLFEKIAEEISRHPEVKRVHLYRDGEPLLDKKLAHRIQRLKRGGVRKVGISTNAELLSEAKASTILMAGLDELILSVDSIDQKTYEAIRVGLDFYKVLANSARVFQIRNEVGSKCKIRLRMIRQESNKDEWQSGRFQNYFRPYTGLDDVIEYRDIHNWGGQLAGFKGITAPDVSKPCLALWSLMTIFADGSVPLCNVDYNNKYPLGNVTSSSIAELWQSSEQNRRRALHMDGKRSEIAPCTNCTVWSEAA